MGKPVEVRPVPAPWFRIPWVRAALVPLILIAAAVFVSISDARRGRVRGDFTRFSLAASRALLQGENPYIKDNVGRNYKYLPTNAVLLFPLAPLPNHVAQGIWFACNTGLIIACVRRHRALLQGLRVPWWVLLIAFGMTFRLIWMNLKLGQWNLPVYCLALVGLEMLHRDRLRGALLVGLAATLKYMPAFFLLYFALRREWRKAGALAAAIVLWVFLVPGLVLGPLRHFELLGHFYTASTHRLHDISRGERSSSLSLRSTVYRMVSPVYIELENKHYYTNLFHLDRAQAARVADGVALAVLMGTGALTFFVVRRRPKLPPEGNLLLIGGWFLSFLMISPGVRHAQLLTLFTPTYAVTALLVSPRVGKGLKRTIAVSLPVVLVLITAPAEIIREARYQLLFEAWGSLAWATVILAALTVAGLLQVSRPEPGELSGPRKEEEPEPSREESRQPALAGVN